MKAHSVAVVSALALLAGLGLATNAATAAEGSGKLGGGLERLVQESEQGPHSAAEPSPAGPRIVAAGRRDGQDRVVVSVVLTGKVPAETVRARLEALGAQVTGVSTFGTGSLSALLPVTAARAAGAIDGVRAINLAHARTRAGSVTSEGVKVLNADDVLRQARDRKGAGITVGVLSDTYDRFGGAATHAGDDVKSGDLPGKASQQGAVVVLDDTSSDGLDEGRAMLQIVHDMAPLARLCFATAFNGEQSFAENILALADRSGRCKADVIVDDVGYFFSPFAQDGIIAQAVDKVAAAGVAYFSAAGNDNGTALQFAYEPIPWVQAAAATPGLDLSTVPPASVPVSLHNFGSAAKPSAIQQLKVAGISTLLLKWDDPTGNGKLGRDYDVLFFFGGKFIGAAADDNFVSDTPNEFAQFSGAGELTALVALYKQTDKESRRSVLREQAFDGLSFVKPHPVDAPTIYGQPCAAGAAAVAAVFAGNPNIPEDYSSKGPCTITLDPEGNRLPAPELRRKPEVAAADGVSTTFFLGRPGKNGKPRFFGTSAAAPHAAGAAALYLADLGRTPPARLITALERSARPHMDHPEELADSLTGGGGVLRIAVKGVAVVQSTDFAIKLDAVPDGTTVAELRLDASTETPVAGVVVPASLKVDPRSDVRAGEVKSVLPNTLVPVPAATYRFAAGAFGRGETFRFGLAYGSSDVFGQIPTQLVGMTVTATLSNGRLIRGRLQPNPTERGYDRSFGYGVIDIDRAIYSPDVTAAPAGAGAGID